MPTILGDKVTVGTITFNDNSAKPSGAVIWKMDVLEGWSDSSDLEVVSTPLGGGADGEILDDYFSASARHMIAGGYCLAATRADAELLKDVIVRDAIPTNIELDLTRYEPVTKLMRVRTAGRYEFRAVGPLGFRWTVPLIAATGKKYGASLLSAGPVGVSGVSSGGFTFPLQFPLVFSTISSGDENALYLNNSGTAWAPATITIHGPVNNGGWRLANETTGEYIGFGVSLSSSDTLVIDFENQIALLNGVSVTSSVIGDFWMLKPGTINKIKLYADYDPLASVSGTYRPAWRN